MVSHKKGNSWRKMWQQSLCEKIELKILVSVESSKIKLTISKYTSVKSVKLNY